MPPTKNEHVYFLPKHPPRTNAVWKFAALFCFFVRDWKYAASGNRVAQQPQLCTAHFARSQMQLSNIRVSENLLALSYLPILWVRTAKTFPDSLFWAFIRNVNDRICNKEICPPFLKELNSVIELSIEPTLSWNKDSQTGFCKTRWSIKIDICCICLDESLI